MGSRSLFSFVSPLDTFILATPLEQVNPPIFSYFFPSLDWMTWKLRLQRSSRERWRCSNPEKRAHFVKVISSSNKQFSEDIYSLVFRRGNVSHSFPRHSNTCFLSRSFEPKNISKNTFSGGMTGCL